MSNFDEWIYYQRRKLGLSKKRMSERLDVTPRTIRRWENKQSLPSLHNINTLSSVLQVDKIDIFIMCDMIDDITVKTKKGKRTVVKIGDDQFTLQHPSQYKRGSGL